MSKFKPIKIINRPAIKMADVVAKIEKDREMPVRISLAIYIYAVERLVKLACGNGGGARAAAQVVLSLYNGNNWQVNLIDLIHLDAGHFRDAITAIRGRVEFNIEPHTLIADGDAIFNLLQDDWRQYHIKNRAQR